MGKAEDDSSAQDHHVGPAVVDESSFHESLSESFLTFLASAFPLTPDDIALWQQEQAEESTDIIDWLIDTGRIDPRIGHILLEFRLKAIGPQEARSAIEAIQEELETANRVVNEAAETSAGFIRPLIDSSVAEAVTDGDEMAESCSITAPLPLLAPIQRNPRRFAAIYPYSKTEVAVSSQTDLSATPPPAASPFASANGRESGDYEYLYGQNFGKYLICTGVGKGTMGAIVLAHHRLLGIPVAIKLLSPALARDDAFRERFFSEGRFAANIQHPALVHVFDCDQRDEWLYLVMEYVDGMSGLELIRTAGHLPEMQALRVARRVAEGLAEAHRHGVIHRDVKPGNILFAKNGQVKLTDLGLARTLAPRSDDTPNFENGSIVGTPLYMAPEQCGAEGSYDHRADIYALGGTLYHLLCGCAPFDGKTVTTLLQQHAQSPVTPLARRGVQVSPRTSALVSWMLAKEPGERPASCEDLIAEIDACLESAANGRATTMRHSPLDKSRRSNSTIDPLGLGQKISALLQGGKTSTG